MTPPKKIPPPPEPPLEATVFGEEEATENAENLDLVETDGAGPDASDAVENHAATKVPRKTTPKSNGNGARHKRRDPIGVFLGVLGELLITAGVVLGLFVVWQVWWTDIEARQHTEAVLAKLEYAPAPAVGIVEEQQQQEEAPLPEIEEDVIGVLYIPKLGKDYRIPIQEGVSLAKVLNTGVAGHYPETAMVGEIGNFALAGHRQSYGAIFHHIDTLAPGDAIIVETRDTWYVFRVSEPPRVIQPTQTDVIAPVFGNASATPTEPAITLTTCHPLWSVKERLVVHGTFDYWSPRDAGTPEELL